MLLRNVDLNLIPMLRSLLCEKSISRAAHKCNLSQSSMSDVLRRLRVTLNDPLLVKVGRRMELTPHAADLIAPLETLCKGLEGFFLPKEFDAASAERTFVIASADHTMFLMTRHWLSQIHRCAPGVRLRFTEISEKYIEQLTARDLDFAVVPSYVLGAVAPDTLRYLPLTRDNRAVLTRQGHPLSSLKELTPGDLAAYRMISFVSSREWAESRHVQSFNDEADMNVAAWLPHITLPPYLLLDTDYFTITSSLIASVMVRLLPLEAHRLLSNAPSVELGLVWSPVQDNDPAHRWFRDMTAQPILERLDD